MPKEKRKDKTVTVEVTFKMKIIVRDGVSLEDLIKKETSFIAEPNSVNGCVVDMKVKNIEKITDW